MSYDHYDHRTFLSPPPPPKKNTCAGSAETNPVSDILNFAAAPETYKQFAAEGGERSSLASLARLRAQLARFARSLASFVD